MSDLRTERLGDIGLIVMQRPPHNLLSHQQIGQIADAAHEFDADPNLRAIVLAADGRSFCAGADIGGSGVGAEDEVSGGPATRELYRQGARLFDVQVPIIAAVQGPAIGGGLGLAVACDFRIASPEARFCANFAALALHQGFGLSVTLPRLLGHQKAAEVLYTAKRYKGDEAYEIGLADKVVPAEELRDAAIEFAQAIAVNAPLALRSIKATLRGGLAAEVRAITDHEAAEQERLSATEDAAEGAASVGERRPGNFVGR